MRRLKLLGGVGMLALLTPPAIAQVTGAADCGREIVVTATPLPDPGEDALAFPARTASDEQLTAAHATDLTEYLKRAISCSPWHSPSPRRSRTGRRRGARCRHRALASGARRRDHSRRRLVPRGGPGAGRSAIAR